MRDIRDYTLRELQILEDAYKVAEHEYAKKYSHREGWKNRPNYKMIGEMIRLIGLARFIQVISKKDDDYWYIQRQIKQINAKLKVVKLFTSQGKEFY